MVSDTQVAQAGQYLGADYVVAGKIQLAGDRAAAAWLWLWFYSGPEGQMLRFERDNNTMLASDPRDFAQSLDPVRANLFDLLAAAPLAGRPRQPGGAACDGRPPPHS